MAHKMGAGSTKNGRDSQSKRLGVKCTGFQQLKTGEIATANDGLPEMQKIGKLKQGVYY
jgi:large subunit ribosomal protein L27